VTSHPEVHILKKLSLDALLSVVLDEEVFQNAHFCFKIFVLVIFFQVETTHY
jgi:hypothetical protein